MPLAVSVPFELAAMAKAGCNKKLNEAAVAVIKLWKSLISGKRLIKMNAFVNSNKNVIGNFAAQ